MILGNTSLMVAGQGSDLTGLTDNCSYFTSGPRKDLCCGRQIGPLQSINLHTVCQARRTGWSENISLLKNKPKKTLYQKCQPLREVNMTSLSARSSRLQQPASACPLHSPIGAPPSSPPPTVILKQIPDIKFQEDTFLLVSPWWMNLFHLSGI